MSSRSATIRVSRAAEVSAASSSSARSAGSERVVAAQGPERPRGRPASGVRRSWETAASSAVRVRLPASSSRAAAV